MSDITRRSFVASSTAVGGCLSSLPAWGTDLGDSFVGPLVGHVDTESAFIWARVPTAGDYRIEVASDDGQLVASEVCSTAAHDDLTAIWRIGGLSHDTFYRYVIFQGDQELAGDEQTTFRTAPPEDLPRKVTLAFGSCALEDAGSRAVWRRMDQHQVDAVVLLGDTPYIDKTTLAAQRSRRREFAAVVEYQKLLRHRPHWTTWDDHDFGANDSDGTLKGKQNSRQAHLEYRPQKSYGDGQHGIYTRFRWGPVEVFLIDARWFAGTEPSPVAQNKKTLLGKAQREWLQIGLKSSTAAVKLLASGIIWDDKQNTEKDDWETYVHERDAIFDFIRQQKIPGVLLVSGDIHVSRLLKYPAESTVGYPLYQLISSPVHARVIPALNVPHPALVHSAVAPNTFLLLTVDAAADEPYVLAQFLDKANKSIFPDTKIALSSLRQG